MTDGPRHVTAPGGLTAPAAGGPAAPAAGGLTAPAAGGPAAPAATAADSRSLARAPGLLAEWRTRAPDAGRFWLIVCCLALAGLAFGSHPGQILADTKIDLAINPGGFLQRALQLWDPTQFGQLQNQAVGYFFPIGPFFLLGKLAAVPAWIIQRLWITAILVAGFTGVVRLCRVLRIGSQPSQLVAGLSYALAPIALSLLGYDSAQVLPAAMLPWILIPLVVAVQAGPDASAGRRARLAAQSAVAVALCSGVNAAATVAVLVPAVIYLLAAPRPAPRWRILAWWIPAVVLATLWWVYPLLLLGRYGVSFLPYTESAQTTTAVTSLFNSLRGTEDWLTQLVSDGQPWLPDGYRISTEALPTVLTGLIAGLGLAGLASRRMPQRRFVLWLLFAGLFVVVTGYVSTFGNPLAAFIDSAINGPLAPLRNLDKFDPLIRLPIALGLANLLAHPRLPRRQAVLTAVAFGAVGLLALPVYVSGLSLPGSFTQVPAYWTSAATWLNRHAGNSAVLEEPGARFGQYTWGSPLDDILQPLFAGDWASSQLGVIGSIGNTRLLETIDQQMSAGTGSAGLTQLLRRMGVKYLVVRNDLLRADLRQAWPARIHDAIAASPGIVKVAQFGSTPAASATADNAVTGVDPPYPPVQIYRVNGAQPPVTVQPTAGTLRVFGAPEALLSLADQGLLAGRPVLLNTDGPQVRTRLTVVTDSLRRRVRNFGEIRDDYSPTLRAGQSLTTFEAAADFIEPGWVRYEAVAKYTGIKNVWAYTSDSGIESIPSQSGTGFLPFAAIDGNLNTMWESGSKTDPVGQWIRIRFDAAIDPGRIRVAFADSPAIGPPVSRVQIRTQAGTLTQRVRATGAYQVLRVPRGPTTWLRIKVLSVRGSSHQRGSQVGIKEISIPGVHPGRTIEAPDVRLPTGGDPTAIVLAKAEPQPSGCMLTDVRWVCSPSLETSTEEQYGFNEAFTVARASAAALSGTAVMTDPQLIEQHAYAGSGQPVVTASSTLTADPADQPSSAFDGDPLTSWISGASDPHPSLTIRWQGAITVHSIVVIRPAGAAGLARLTITGSGGQARSVILGGPGSGSADRVSFAPMTTDSLTLTFALSSMPVQVTDVEIPGVPQLTADPSAPVSLGCGQGPAIDVSGKAVPTRASGTVEDLLTGRPLTFTACSRVPIAAGNTTIVEPSADAFSVQAITVNLQTARLSGAVAPSDPVRTVSWTQSRRVVRVAAAQQSYLVVNENYNTGWQATLAGHTLQPVRLDGWKQGWILPAGSRGLVTLTYGPQAQYDAALWGGGFALLVVVIVAFLVPVRRRRGPATARAMPAAAQSGAAMAAEPSGAGPAHTGAVPATEPTGAAPRAGNAANSSGAAAAGSAVSARRFASARRLASTRSRVPLGAGLSLTCLLGLWVGGYVGAVLLPLLTLGFGVALALRSRSRIARRLTEPLVTVGLLVAAAASDAVGVRLTYHAGAGNLVRVLSGIIPELACLVIVGRLAAALLSKELGPKRR
jgi:arabinofuranan 3-O-arabinosyltransferase